MNTNQAPPDSLPSTGGELNYSGRGDVTTAPAPFPTTRAVGGYLKSPLEKELDYARSKWSEWRARGEAAEEHAANAAAYSENLRRALIVCGGYAMTLTLVALWLVAR